MSTLRRVAVCSTSDPLQKSVSRRERPSTVEVKRVVQTGGSIRLVNMALRRLALNAGGNGGVVVLMASVSGLHPEDWAPVYSASKHAVTALTRSWAGTKEKRHRERFFRKKEKNFRCHGIRFNCLCPGAVDTQFLSQIGNAYHAEEHQNRLDTVPRLKPTFIADGFIRLIEDDSINGQAMYFDAANQTAGLHQFNDSSIS